jgi:hypothetical protein
VTYFHFTLLDSSSKPSTATLTPRYAWRIPSMQGKATLHTRQIYPFKVFQRYSIDNLDTFVSPCGLFAALRRCVIRKACITAVLGLQLLQGERNHNSRPRYQTPRSRQLNREIGRRDESAQQTLATRHSQTDSAESSAHQRQSSRGGAFLLPKNLIGGRSMAENPYLAVRLSPTLRSQLKAEAAVRGIKPTDLIRMLVVDFCDNHSRARGPKEEAHVR